MNAQILTDTQCKVGEGPLWHPDEKKLYWTDILSHCLHSYDPISGHCERFDIGRPVGGFTIQVDGALLLFMDGGAVGLFREGKLQGLVVKSIPQEKKDGSRFNDVIADPHGRVFCGTLNDKTGGGRLYRLNLDGEMVKLGEGYGCPNGMAFSEDHSTFYFTDSSAFTIWAFRYQLDNGDISHGRVQVKTAGNGGYPDGLTLDAAGNLWSAKWDGWGVEQYSIDGKLLQKIDVPTAAQVSCVTFGGDDYSQMYLTTAGGDKRETLGPDAGKLMRVDVPGVRGRAEYRSRIRAK